MYHFGNAMYKNHEKTSHRDFVLNHPHHDMYKDDLDSLHDYLVVKHPGNDILLWKKTVRKNEKDTLNVSG